MRFLTGSEADHFLLVDSSSARQIGMRQGPGKLWIQQVVRSQHTAGSVAHTLESQRFGQEHCASDSVNGPCQGPSALNVNDFQETFGQCFSEHNAYKIKVSHGCSFSCAVW